MPVIDGVKVACIPCIRGHRSTKCTHQAERIMIPVRKPGRPLSSCPHQKGKPCNCNNITAAIPRNGKCGCGTSEPIITDTRAPVKTEPLTSDIVPMSPTKTTSFRVQKHVTPKSPSRRQSYDISLLGQMDPNTINVMPSHGLTLGTNGNLSHAGPMPSPGFMPNFQSSFSSEGALSQNLEYARMLGRLEGAALHTFFENSVSNPSSTGLSSNGTSSHSSLDTSGTSHYSLTSESPNSSSYTKGFSTEGVGCCGKALSTTPLANEQLEERKLPQNGLGLMRYEDSMSTHGPNLSTLGFNGSIHDRPPMQHTQQDTTYTYPVSYGSSFYEPLQFSQWQQMMTNQAQSIPPQNAYMGSHSRMETAAPVSDSCATHQCGCGEGCQCLGCSTHPFNSAMQEYVLSALQDGQSISPSLSNGDINGAPNGTNEASPKTLASPVADGSPASEAGSTGMNDYLFVAYCPGSPQSCPCGDECACVGCMIHCEPGPRTPPTPP
ncbi:hypothetical protein F5Y12DRAFT_340029 [Xylaria sp. FL1777]|nr:hypothetical protein F5Y12DRAFT_340029 [Xylaria sp. FL1777]